LGLFISIRKENELSKIADEITNTIDGEDNFEFV
jgi:hypothetical protein